MNKPYDPHKFDHDPLPPFDEFQWMPPPSRKPPQDNDLITIAVISMLAGGIIWYILLYPIYNYITGE